MTLALKTFYGRRKGRPLRCARTNAVEETLPKVRFDMPIGDAVLDPASMFESYHSAYWLEIGFGGGEHLAAQMRANPGVAFVGSEVFINGVASLLTQVAEPDLSRLRLFPDDVRPLLTRLKSESFEKIFVMFPDPWPKVRHHKRRLLQVSLLETLTRLLIPGGILHIASDHEDYVREILESTAKVAGLSLQGDESTWAKPFFGGAFPTRYETKARLEGRASSYFPFVKG